jgi:hypothetical protein
MGRRAFRDRHARNLVIMLATGGTTIEDVLRLAQEHGVRPSHVKRLDVPHEEQGARQRLIRALSQSDKYVAPTQAVGGKHVDRIALDLLKRVEAGADADDIGQMATAFGVTGRAIQRAAKTLRAE